MKALATKRQRYGQDRITVLLRKSGVGVIESFNGNLRDEFLNLELFLSLEEAKYVAERWRLDYNHHRPHSSLNWMTPAAFAASCPSAVDGHGCVPRGSAAPRPSAHTRNATETPTRPGT